jgi:hypothetical protein
MISEWDNTEFYNTHQNEISKKRFIPETNDLAAKSLFLYHPNTVPVQLKDFGGTLNLHSRIPLATCHSVGEISNVLAEPVSPPPDSNPRALKRSRSCPPSERYRWTPEVHAFFETAFSSLPLEEGSIRFD